ncbi:FadR/GntR family transcriptional regulator [Shewanella glacialimarina]|jgi:DNA-binding FadR family transcriptional regulator|uniref:FadR/GntR family transcriptional regulator n=1 Tax=Shewanella glacialimarina TaxID=2590884 RepID=UPI001CF8B280|nr:FadR/GntR family transcriptional regulator [Shewanella glacialimarina]UCX06462.1 FadR family transcriptional regulator [Shewanella glacialimarina]
MASIPRQNLTHQLTHDLGIAIVSGEYPIGEGLPSEADLCVKYDVSRSSTREAVKMLSAKGLITSRPKQGIRVMPESQWNMFDIDVLHWILSSKPSLSLLKEFTQMRLALEPEAAALAAKSATAEQIEHLGIALQRMKDAELGLEDPLEADILFHANILCSSNNRFFIQMTGFTSTALKVSLRYTNQMKGVNGANVQDHAAIYNAIRMRQPELAKTGMVKIINELLVLIDSRL